MAIPSGPPSLPAGHPFRPRHPLRPAIPSAPPALPTSPTAVEARSAAIVPRQCARRARPTGQNSPPPILERAARRSPVTAHSSPAACLPDAVSNGRDAVDPAAQPPRAALYGRSRVLAWRHDPEARIPFTIPHAAQATGRRVAPAYSPSRLIHPATRLQYAYRRRPPLSWSVARLAASLSLAFSASQVSSALTSSIRSPPRMRRAESTMALPASFVTSPSAA